MSGVSGASGQAQTDGARDAVWLRLLLAVWSAEGLWFLTRPAGPLRSDAASYWSTGGVIVRTHVISNYWPPGYPLIAAAFHLWGGIPALVALQTVLTGLLVLWVQAWVRQRYGTRPALVFLGGNALLPVLYLYSRFVLSDVWLIYCLCGWCVWTDRALRGRGSFAWGGLALAVGTAIRPEALPVGALELAWLLYARRPRAALAAIAPLAAEVVCWGGYNRLAAGAWIFTQHNFWVNIWAGNNPRSFGFMTVPVQPAGAAPAVYRALALHWLAGHPLRFVLLCLVRVAVFWFSSPSSIQALAVQAHVAPRGWMVLATAMTAARAAAFLGGVWWLMRQRQLGEVLAPLAAILALWGFTVPFFAGGRFVLPAIPFALIVAGVAWQHFRESTTVG